MEIRKYEDGMTLGEHEYLLKVNNTFIEYPEFCAKSGFLTKLNAGNKKPPKKFLDWGNEYTHRKNPNNNYSYIREHLYSPEIFVVDQSEFRRGWALLGYRSGESQDWVKILHPDGYILEVHAKHFYDDILPRVTIDLCKIMAEMRWVDGKLELID
ncbi:hypothetical protein MA9V2_137 [Chryseobacterium phage MA9V-2]|nr:hypothetical protein MA9V2_137 [Chryseobacterium phage MA9V-2]